MCLLEGMIMPLLVSRYVDLPPHQPGGFDHADVHLESGRVYVAHTATGTVEAIDGEQAKHLATLPGCLEASGVVCAQNENLVFAASRGAGVTFEVHNALDQKITILYDKTDENGIAEVYTCRF